MNQVSLIGRMTKDIEIRDYKTADGEGCVGMFTLAVERGKDAADFISCKAFGRTAEFLEDNAGKGTRIGVTGRIQTGSYENKKGDRVYTTDVIVERVYFADGKREAEKPDPEQPIERARSRARR